MFSFRILILYVGAVRARVKFAAQLPSLAWCLVFQKWPTFSNSGLTLRLSPELTNCWPMLSIKNVILIKWFVVQVSWPLNLHSVWWPWHPDKLNAPWTKETLTTNWCSVCSSINCNQFSWYYPPKSISSWALPLTWHTRLAILAFFWLLSHNLLELFI